MAWLGGNIDMIYCVWLVSGLAQVSTQLLPLQLSLCDSLESYNRLVSKKSCQRWQEWLVSIYYCSGPQPNHAHTWNQRWSHEDTLNTFNCHSPEQWSTFMNLVWPMWQSDMCGNNIQRLLAKNHHSDEYFLQTLVLAVLTWRSGSPAAACLLLEPLYTTQTEGLARGRWRRWTSPRC